MLTDTERTEIKRHLSFHAVKQSFFPVVEGFRAVDDIMDFLDVTPATEAAVRVILGRLAKLETQLDGAGGRLKATRVGSIALDGGEEHDQLWREIKRWRKELSTLIGIPIRGQSNALTVV